MFTGTFGFFFVLKLRPEDLLYASYMSEETEKKQTNKVLKINFTVYFRTHFFPAAGLLP